MSVDVLAIGCSFTIRTSLVRSAVTCSRAVS